MVVVGFAMSFQAIMDLVVQGLWHFVLQVVEKLTVAALCERRLPASD